MLCFLHIEWLFHANVLIQEKHFQQDDATDRDTCHNTVDSYDFCAVE